MESSSTTDQHTLKMLRIRCKELGITAEAEQELDALASVSIPLAINSAKDKVCREESAAKDKVRRKAFEESAAKDKERIKALEEKAAKDKVREAKDKVRIEALEEENLKNVKLVESSIERTYGNTILNFKQPSIQLNELVEPSVGGNTRTFKIKNSEGKIEEVQMDMPTVKIQQNCEEMWVDIKNVKIPVVTRYQQRHASILGAAVTPHEELEYSNEFTVQAYCQDMIKDALKSLGLLKEVGTHLEFSMYLMKPDIVLVVKCQGRIFFAAEVKSPEIGDKKVFGNEVVAGQIWSYLYAMKASGNQCPIGAIMTYNKISIVTLGDYIKNEQGEEDQQHKKRITAAQKCLSEGHSPVRKLDEEVKQHCTSRKSSPIKPRKHFNITNREDNEDFQKELCEENVDRVAFCSRVHEEKEVFPCLLQAIEIAYQTICDADAEQAVCIKAKIPIGRRLVFKLGESSLAWVKIGGNVCAKINGNIPMERTEYLYNLGKLGDGGTASVYLACSTGGRVCALKDYYIRQSSAAYANEREEEENMERVNLIEKAENEERRWTEIYGRRYQARAQCFGGKHCLLMPYGYQVATKPDDRWQHVSGIKKELEFFTQCSKGANGRPGYKYKDSDLRWRHALLDTEKKIFLCDLESLVEIDNTESVDDIVYKQLAILLKPMRSEEEEKKTLAWLLRSNTSDVVSFIYSVNILIEFFERISQDKCGKILESLFPSTVTFQDLSVNSKAVVTMCMISHYRKEQLAKQQCEASQSDTSIPDLQESQSIEKALGNGEHPEDANKGRKRRKII